MKRNITSYPMHRELPGGARQREGIKELASEQPPESKCK